MQSAETGSHSPMIIAQKARFSPVKAIYRLELPLLNDTILKYATISLIREAELFITTILLDQLKRVRLVICLISILAVCSCAFLGFVFPAQCAESLTLTVEQRAHYQRLIEEVYWQNRIWPNENPYPKPSLKDIVSDSFIQEKVEDYLRKSNALEAYWNRPITSVQLQSEINRMTQNTKQPDLLKQLFNALNNDPYLIAECLARPLLADRLIRDWYAYDDRFHGNLKNRIQIELLSSMNLPGMSGNYSEYEYDLHDQKDLDQWYSLQLKFRTQNAMKLNLHQNEDSFFVYRILKRSSDRIHIAIVRWPKTSFDEWWKGVKSQIVIDNPSNIYTYHLEDVPQGSCQDDTWRPTAAPPDPRSYHTAIWTGTEMIIWGGTSSSGYFNSGARYAPATDTWMPISNVGAPSPRFTHTAIWTGSQMIIWGGFNGTELNDGGRYDFLTDSWLPLNITNAPSARRSHTAIWTGSEMIIWGGFDVDFLGDGGRYNPTSDSWTAVSQLFAPLPRLEHTAVWTGTEMIIWGGWSTVGPTNTGARYNPATDIWTPTDTNSAPGQRFLHTAVWTDSEMIIWGGYLGDYLNTGARYNPVSNSWSPVNATNAPSARTGHTAVWSGSEMIIWGGYQQGTGGRYNPVLDSWSETSATSAPFVREHHSAVWTGSEMIIWGGTDFDIFYNDGARYDPVSDTWIATNVFNTPSPRENHTAVWTGSEMIVWGGIREIDDYVNTGATYAPSTDTWAATDLTNAPTARVHHVAVWTGTEMIIWGGLSQLPELLNSGGRFNPATNQWIATNTFNAPTGRYNHTGIWTGTEMIIWGGIDPNPANSGGRYNPVADSWLPTSTTNAPTGRIDHTAIWSGTEMIVWGGVDSGFFTNTGGRYDPVFDSWTITTTVDAPTPRSLHSAIWTGSEMIVWGGYIDSGATNTGGTYNPISDIWFPTTTIDAPPPTSAHTVIWTGSEMIIFGGSSAYTASGRYRPITDKWRLTSTINEPTKRDKHTGVWTGDEMIVWGGTPRVNTGGIYCAARPPVCLYCDNFNDGVQPNWTEIKPDCNESSGFMNCDPTKRKAIIIATPAFPGCQNCSIETSVLMTADVGGRIWMLTHYIDKRNTLEILFNEENDKVVIKQRANGSVITKAKAAVTLIPNTLYSVQIQYDGKVITVNIDGAPTPQITFTPIGILPIGTVGFQSKNTIGMFDYIAVY